MFSEASFTESDLASMCAPVWLLCFVKEECPLSFVALCFCVYLCIDSVALRCRASVNVCICEGVPSPPGSLFVFPNELCAPFGAEILSMYVLVNERCLFWVYLSTYLSTYLFIYLCISYFLCMSLSGKGEPLSSAELLPI